MPLPLPTDFTGPNITEAQFKTAMTDMRDFLAGLLGTTGGVPAAQAALDVIYGAGVTAKSGAYTIATTDRGQLFDCTGTWTLSLPAAATAGAGFAFAVRNSGSGTITIDGNGAETVDGAANMALLSGASSVLVCTGSAWLSIGSSVVDHGDESFTTAGTHDFVVPAGVSAVWVWLRGGGGAGGSINGSMSPGFSTGGTGGTTSFGAHISAPGGAGGGSVAGANGSPTGAGIRDTIRADFMLAASLRGGGGNGGSRTSPNSATAGAGGNGGSILAHISGLTPGATISVTVGAGGAISSSTYNGGAGGAGGAFIWW